MLSGDCPRCGLPLADRTVDVYPCFRFANLVCPQHGVVATVREECIDGAWNCVVVTPGEPPRTGTVPG